jgi:hypothetical protein
VVGYTCCHASDLTNLLPSLFHERIDFVFARNVPSGEKLFGTIDIVGNLPSERTGATQPRWASDHAGLAATLFVPAGR